MSVVALKPEQGVSELHRLVSDYGHLGGKDLLEAMIKREFSGKIAVSTSFGAEAAVLLSLTAEIDPHTPVVFLDTGRHFPETRRYGETLRTTLGLTDVRFIAPDADIIAKEDPDGKLAYQNPDRCCHIRKVLPLERAMAGFSAWVTGRKRFHGDNRAALPHIEWDGAHFKINPLAGWSKEQIDARFKELDLPAHPMVEDGFLSIGCMPCTERTENPDDIRSGRWAGKGKTECGIHKSAWF